MAMAALSGKIFAGAVAIALATALMLAGCADRHDRDEAARGKIVVVATILPLADWARQVGGDRVFVQVLLPAGTSPHTFDPTPRDMRLISRAKLLLKVGLHMDDWGASLAGAAGKQGPQVISLGEELLKAKRLPDVEHFEAQAEQIGTSDAHNHDHDHGHEGHDHHHHHGVNPHFWVDPQVAMDCVRIIRDRLTEADPAGKEEFAANAEKYLAELSALDSQIREELAPYKGAGFVSFHNAFPYLAQRYELKILAVIEEYAGKAPGEKYLRTVAEKLKSLGVKTVFSEPQLNPRLADVLAHEIGAQVRVLDPYGTEGVAGRDTYVGVMRYNASELAAAFKAEKPQ